MIKPLEDFTFKSETGAFLFATINHFLEGIDVTFDTLISHQVDRSKASLTEQAFDDIAVV